MHRGVLFSILFATIFLLSPIFASENEGEQSVEGIEVIDVDIDNCNVCSANVSGNYTSMITYAWSNASSTKVYANLYVELPSGREPISEALILFYVTYPNNHNELLTPSLLTDNEGRIEMDVTSDIISNLQQGECANVKAIYCPSHLSDCDYWLCLRAAGVDESAQGASKGDPTIQYPRPSTTLPSSSSTIVCKPRNSGLPANLQSTLCLPIFIIGAILGGALFAAGRNPFLGFDIGTLRLKKHFTYTPRRIVIPTFNIAAQVEGAVRGAIKGAGKSVESKAERGQKLTKEEVKEIFKSPGLLMSIGKGALNSTIVGRFVKGAPEIEGIKNFATTVKGISKGNLKLKDVVNQILGISVTQNKSNIQNTNQNVLVGERGILFAQSSGTGALTGWNVLGILLLGIPKAFMAIRNAEKRGQVKKGEKTKKFFKELHDAVLSNIGINYDQVRSDWKSVKNWFKGTFNKYMLTNEVLKQLFSHSQFRKPLDILETLGNSKGKLSEIKQHSEKIDDISFGEFFKLFKKYRSQEFDEIRKKVTDQVKEHMKDPKNSESEIQKIVESNVGLTPGQQGQTQTPGQQLTAQQDQLSQTPGQQGQTQTPGQQLTAQQDQLSQTPEELSQTQTPGQQGQTLTPEELNQNQTIVQQLTAQQDQLSQTHEELSQNQTIVQQGQTQTPEQLNQTQTPGQQLTAQQDQLSQTPEELSQNQTIVQQGQTQTPEQLNQTQITKRYLEEMADKDFKQRYEEIDSIFDSVGLKGIIKNEFELSGLFDEGKLFEFLDSKNKSFDQLAFKVSFLLYFTTEDEMLASKYLAAGVSILQKNGVFDEEKIRKKLNTENFSSDQVSNAMYLLRSITAYDYPLALGSSNLGDFSLSPLLLPIENPSEGKLNELNNKLNEEYNRHLGYAIDAMRPFIQQHIGSIISPNPEDPSHERLNQMLNNLSLEEQIAVLALVVSNSNQGEAALIMLESQDSESAKMVREVLKRTNMLVKYPASLNSNPDLYPTEGHKEATMKFIFTLKSQISSMQQHSQGGGKPLNPNNQMFNLNNQTNQHI